jgi:hypothetical protein
LTGRQDPRAAAFAQNWHLPPHAFSQQTPSVQNPDMHWLPAVQVAPFPRGPQLPLVHVAGATHWASPVHVVRQLLPSQPKGAQSSAVALMHVPSPSHSDAGVNVRGPAQLGTPHGLPAPYFAQPP